MLKSQKFSGCHQLCVILSLTQNLKLQFTMTIDEINQVWDNFRKAMSNIEGVDRYELSISLRTRAINNGSYAKLVLESMKKK